jgi:hypothetical protein
VVAAKLEAEKKEIDTSHKYDLFKIHLDDIVEKYKKNFSVFKKDNFLLIIYPTKVTEALYM